MPANHAYRTSTYASQTTVFDTPDQTPTPGLFAAVSIEIIGLSDTAAPQRRLTAGRAHPQHSPELVEAEVSRASFTWRCGKNHI